MKTSIYTLLLVLFFVSCEKDPEYTPKKVSLKGGELYQFESFYSGGNKSVLWNFGDGHTSTETDPNYTYTTPGTFPVTLSKYKNGKLFDKFVKYMVTVEQLYKPRVYGIEYHCQADDENTYPKYDYFYKNYFAKFNFVENPDIDSDNYKYQILFNNEMIDTGSSSSYAYFSPFILPDTGFFDVSFTVFDENNISDTFDTTIYVGSHTTQLNIKVPDFYLAQLGTIAEQKLLVYDNNDIYNYKVRDFSNAVNYGGPSTGSFVSTNGTGSFTSINNGTGSGLWDGDTYYGLDIYNLTSTINNIPFTIEIPALEIGGYDEYNDLHLIAVIIGDQGMAYGQVSFEITPGTVTPIIDLDLTFKSF